MIILWINANENDLQNIEDSINSIKNKLNIREKVRKMLVFPITEKKIDDIINLYEITDALIQSELGKIVDAYERLGFRLKGKI